MQHKKISSFWRAKKPVFLKNCEVKRSRRGDKMDIVLKNITQVVESTKSFEDTGVVDGEGDEITMCMIEERDNFDKVDVCCKVVKVKEPAAVGVHESRMKQDIVVADRTGVGRVALWEDRAHRHNECRCQLSTRWLSGARVWWKEIFVDCQRGFNNDNCT